MEASKPKPGPVSGQLTAQWHSSTELEQAFVDELLVHLVKDRVYITFGQLALPLSPDVTKTGAEIVPKARIIVTRESLARMLVVLNRLNDENPERIAK